ncbi:NAD-P-binding protein [Auriscalpium vulgare]|uniref:NAD-P-binding protein n=1 Tax=Auriscalpium vulgare TaxID=40419 RepID=A0ACB8RXA4_9AGAM|nr:NAD-P-binding protein [Auriscalpium vulgare]
MRLFAKAYHPQHDIPDLSGKVAIVTGANSGIGYHTALQLAAHGARVYLACRTPVKAHAAIETAEAAVPALKGSGRLAFLALDLASLRSCRRAAEDFVEKEGRLDILVNNAGRLSDEYLLTEDGIEQSVSVNHVGMSVFTHGLLGLLKKTAKQPDSDVRIVVVSSGAYRWAMKAPKFASLEDFNDFQGKEGSDDWWPKFTRYGTSKLMNLLWVPELQRRLDAENVPITVMALHPGTVSTDGLKAYSPWWLNVWISLTAITPTEGAHTTLFAATSKTVLAERAKFKGAYLEPFGRVVQPVRREVADRALATTLWETTEKIAADVLSRPKAG